MCGFVALWCFDGKPVDERVLRAMRDSISHRGPDDEGTYIDGAVGLGHRRLSIVDLSAAGHQPMCNEDGTLWLVFNGAIYNYVELRRELIQQGHRFSSHTDSEVILHLYEQEGERCVERLGGMFAFMIWDARKQQLFGARDRLGIKPFHYFVDQNQFICASEVKAILAHEAVPRIADRAALADYLFAGFPLSNRTAFRGIHQLEPGYAISVDGTGLKLHKYWDIDYRYQQRSDAALIAETRALLEDAVAIHCRSDTPVGCHLSGGLDSSTVTCMAARNRPALKTFSIRFGQGGYYDETFFAKIVAQHAGADYFETAPSAEDLSILLPYLIRHMEMPLPNTGGFSYYTVSRLAAQHVKVTLTGHGGDEVFAGYPAQFEAAFGVRPFEQMASAAGATPQAASRLARLRRLVSRVGVRGLLNKAYHRARQKPRTLDETWIALHCSQRPADDPLLDRRFLSSLSGYSPVEDYLAPLHAAPTDQALDRCLYHDLRSYLPALLFMEDRVSMSVSLESRTPLLDHRLVEFMATVPPAQKVLGMEPKALLRAAAQETVPQAILNRRDRRPFPVPLDHWFVHELSSFARAVLLSPQSLDRGIFSPNQLRRWDLSGTQVWAAVNVELWFRVFIDRDPAWLAAADSVRPFCAAG